MTDWQKKTNKEAYLVTGTKTFENPTVQWQAAAHKGTEARADVPLGDAANLPAAATGIPPGRRRGPGIEGRRHLQGVHKQEQRDKASHDTVRIFTRTRKNADLFASSLHSIVMPE